MKTIVPRVYGLTTDSERRKGPAGSAGKKWDEDSFFGSLRQEVAPSGVGAARQILEWAEQRASYDWWGEGTSRGSFVPILVHHDVKHQLFAVWTNGYIEFYFQYYQHKAPFEGEPLRRELLRRLNGIEGVALGDDVLGRRPSLELSVFSGEERMNELLRVFDWVVDEIQGVS